MKLNLKTLFVFGAACFIFIASAPSVLAEDSPTPSASPLGPILNEADIQSLIKKDIDIQSIQNEANKDTQDQANIVATVSIQETKIVSQNGNKIKLSFILKNSSGVQSGIQYSVKLIKDINDIQSVIDEKVYLENIVLGSGEGIVKEIEYQAPKFLKGKYVIWVFVVNSKALILSMGLAGDVILNGSGQYINIDPCVLKVKNDQSKNEFAESGYSLRHGVDVIPAEELTINCQVVNNFNENIVFIPQFENYFRSIYGKLIFTQKQDPISLNAGESRGISLIIPKVSEPQAYDIVLTFLDNQGEAVSNKIFAHYVIQGVSGTVQNLVFDKDFYQKGEIAKFSLYVTGPADIFFGRRGSGTNLKNALVEVMVVDENGNKCSEKISKQFSAQADSDISSNINIDIDIPIIADCLSPKATVELKDGSGNVLDQNIFQAITKKSISAALSLADIKKWLIPGVTIALLILSGVGLFYLLRRKKESGGVPPLAVLLTIFACTGLFIGLSAGNAQAFSAPSLNSLAQGAILNSDVTFSWNRPAGFTPVKPGVSVKNYTCYSPGGFNCVNYNVAWYELVIKNLAGTEVWHSGAIYTESYSFAIALVLKSSGNYTWEVIAKKGENRTYSLCELSLTFDDCVIAGNYDYVCQSYSFTLNCGVPNNILHEVGSLYYSGSAYYCQYSMGFWPCSSIINANEYVIAESKTSSPSRNFSVLLKSLSFVIPPYSGDWAQAYGTATLNKGEYSPGESIILSGTATAAFCYNDAFGGSWVYATLLDLSGNVIVKKLVSGCGTAGGEVGCNSSGYTTFTAPTALGNYYIEILAYEFGPWGRKFVSYLGYSVKSSCAETSWSPDPATVCSGESFNQTGATCGETQTAVGSKSCSHGCSAGNCLPFAEIITPEGDAGAAIGESITFTGIGSDSDGSVAGFEWRDGSCSGGTLLSTAASFTKSDFSTGNHRIYFRVKDDSGAWSTNCPSVNISIYTNNPPSVSGLGAPVQPNYCFSGPTATFSWIFFDKDKSKGDTQSAYRVQADNDSNFSSPEVDSEKVSSASHSYAAPTGRLAYSQTYYWRVMVWDSHDAASAWASGPRFTTPKHAYPTIDLSWTPKKPFKNEKVNFVDESIVYSATKSTWFWTFQDGSPASSVVQNPETKFISRGQKTVTLRVTDSDGYSCRASNDDLGKPLLIQFALPKWKEVISW